ncbi:MAG: Sir2 family NAD-dependent protein deacetylase, partial [Halospina sp.]
MWRTGNDSSFRLSEHVVVLTGAGISAESGLSTFRDAGGLWEQVAIEDVATPEAWTRNPGLVRDFYNHRRHQVLAASPNAAHEALVNLEHRCRVSVV